MGNGRELITNENELFLQGVEKTRQGEQAGAIRVFVQVLQLNPEDANAYGHRCVARYRLGDDQGAIADCQQAAVLYLAQGKTKEHHYALKMLQKLQPQQLRQTTL